MTTRHKGYVVTLAEDLREDDAEPVINALRMVRGVISVEPVTASIDDDMARERARQELVGELREVLKKKR